MLFLEKLEQKRVYIISIMLICILLGVVCSICFIPKEYVASTTILLLNIEKDAEENTKNNGNLELSSNIVSTLEEIIKSESTIEKVKNDLNLNMKNKEIHKRIEVKRISDSDTLKVEVKYIEAETAAKIAEEIVNIFSEKIKQTFGNTEIYIVDSAHIVKEIQILPIVIGTIASMVGGVCLSLIYIILSMRIDKMIKNSKDIEAEIALKNLISIPLNSRKKNTGKAKSELIAYENEKSIISKRFKELRSNIQFINVKNKGKNIILVTSPHKGEGKSYISANMAVSFAEVGKKVILIDADMNTGRQGKIFNIPNNLGVSNYLSNLDSNGTEINELINKYINETAIKNLNLITAGTKPPNSSELLALPRMAEMIKDLSIFYDVVIIDGTPALTTVDSLILTRIANSTVIVTDYKRTKKDDLWSTKKDIQNVGGKISGVIINKVKIKEKVTGKGIDKREVLNKIKIISKAVLVKTKQGIILLIDASKKFIGFVKKNIEKIKERKKEKLLLDGKKDANTVILQTEERIKVANPNSVNVQTKLENEQININTPVKVAVGVKEEKISEVEEIEGGEQETIPGMEIDKKEEYTEEKYEEGTYSETKNGVPEVEASKTPFGIEVFENQSNGRNNIFDFVKNAKLVITDKIRDIRKNKLREKEEYEKGIYVEEAGEGPVIEEADIKPSKLNKRINNSDSLKDIQKALENSRNASSENEINEETILVIVNADSGVCRAFNKYCFTEKLVRGIDKVDGFVKAHYSAYLLNRRVEGLMFLYGLTKKQAKRVDTLIYTTLSDYDDCVWLERKMASNKAEAYVRCMVKEYDRLPGERKKDYISRCQNLRKLDLKKQDIEIEYQINNIWKSSEMKFTDKLVMKRFADYYENKFNSKTFNVYRYKEKLSLSETNPVNQTEFEKDDIRTMARNNKEKLKEYFNNVEIDQVKIKSVEELEQEVVTARTKKLEDFGEQQRYEKAMMKKHVQDQKKMERQEKKKIREASKRNKELERERQKEEARIEEELLGDNLYPKTKFNKDL